VPVWSAFTVGSVILRNLFPTLGKDDEWDEIAKKVLKLIKILIVSDIIIILGEGECIRGNSPEGIHIMVDWYVRVRFV
jgi:hypothetical protein